MMFFLREELSYAKFINAPKYRATILLFQKLELLIFGIDMLTPYTAAGIIPVAFQIAARIVECSATQRAVFDGYEITIDSAGEK